ncbi:MAG: adaptor protein MecA [Clostridia bacterium]|nr:adaptor protein MecA [Clostridia bacterium]
MELIRISESALKVTLTKEDMESYDIVFETLDYENIETRLALTEILAEAKRTAGFFADSDKLYIQAFSDGAGGCELFVSREMEERLYEFSNLSQLLLACARLKNCGYSGESTVFRKRYGEGYFLQLAKKGDYIFLSEIAEQRRVPKGFLGEHTEKLCDSAVEVLGELK